MFSETAKTRSTPSSSKIPARSKRSLDDDESQQGQGDSPMEGNDASRSTPDCSTSMEAEDSETKRLQTEKQGKGLLIQLSKLICHTLECFMYTLEIKIVEAQKNIQQEVRQRKIFSKK